MEVCKYCLCPITELDETEFIYPCKCTNPVCEACLQKYININNRTICEICKEPYKLSETNIIIYPKNPAPNDIPMYYENFESRMYKYTSICVLICLLILVIIFIVLLYRKH